MEYWTPEEAHARRTQKQQQKAKRELDRRQESRQERKWQTRQRMRPKRERDGNGWTSFVTVNHDCANGLRDELQFGTTLKHMDYLLVQEHRQRGEGLASLKKWFHKAGWDTVADAAHLKDTDPGGGTAVLARGIGLRPLGHPAEEAEGRITMAASSTRGGIVNASVYGISGGGVTAQRRLLNHLIARLMLYGLPFVVGGDWQISPDQLAATGICAVLDADIVRHGVGTNQWSGNELDYFLVSRTLLHDGTWDTEVIDDCAFAPHRLVVFRLKLGTQRAREKRLAQPRLLPVERICGPLPRVTTTIDWRSWPSRMNLDGNNFNNVNSMN